MLSGLSKILKDRTREADAKHSRGQPRWRKFYGNRFTANKIDLKERVSEDSNVVISLKVFEKLSSPLVCSTCHSMVEFDIVSRAGLGFKLRVNCYSCHEIGKIDSCLMTGRDRNNIYDLNLRSIFAMAMVGLGHRGLETICAVMNHLCWQIHRNSL